MPEVHVLPAGGTGDLPTSAFPDEPTRIGSKLSVAPGAMRRMRQLTALQRAGTAGRHRTSILALLCPVESGGAASWVGGDLLRRRSGRLFGYRGVYAVAQGVAKRILDAPMLPAVEADHADTPTPAKAVGGDTQKLLESPHLVINEDAQGLEGSCGRMSFAGRRDGESVCGTPGASFGGKNQTGKLSRPSDRLDGSSLDNRLSDALVVRLVGQFPEMRGQFVCGQRCQEVGRRT